MAPQCHKNRQFLSAPNRLRLPSTSKTHGMWCSSHRWTIYWTRRTAKSSGIKINGCASTVHEACVTTACRWSPTIPNICLKRRSNTSRFIHTYGRSMLLPINPRSRARSCRHSASLSTVSDAIVPRDILSGQKAFAPSASLARSACSRRNTAWLIMSSSPPLT